MIKVPIYTNALSALQIFLRESVCFLRKTKVQGYKSPTTMHFKKQHVPTVQVSFRFRGRHLKRKFCAKPRGPDASHFPSKRSAPNPPENKRKIKKKLCTQQTLFGSLCCFEPQRNRGENCRLAHSSKGANNRGGRGTSIKTLPKPESWKKQAPSNGSAKRPTRNWLLNALSVIHTALMRKMATKTQHL